MFTIDQIKAAHAKVKSGADFPAYIRDLKQLGVRNYVAYVVDSHIQYMGADGYTATAPGKYAPLVIAPQADMPQFTHDLKAHQQGKTDYLTFCNDCAKSGVDRWVMDLEQMTCTYFDVAGNEVLVETVPA